MSDHFDSFLDNMLRSAEGLEQKQKNETFSSIELEQISNFFTKIAPNSKKTTDGSLLLAQQGIDSTKTEKLINSLKKSEDEDNTKANPKKKDIDKNQYHVCRMTTALERFEKRRFKNIDEKWLEIREKTYSKENENDEKKGFYEKYFVDTNMSIFKKDMELQKEYISGALTLANATWEAITKDLITEKNNKEKKPVYLLSSITKILNEWAIKYLNPRDELLTLVNAFFCVFQPNNDFNNEGGNLKECFNTEYINKGFIENSISFLHKHFRKTKIIGDRDLDEETIKKIMDLDNENLEKEFGNFNSEKGKKSDKEANLEEIFNLIYSDKYRETSNKKQASSWHFIWDLILSDLTALIPLWCNKFQPNLENINILCNALKKSKNSNFDQGKPDNLSKAQTYERQCFEYAFEGEDLKIKNGDIYEDLFSFFVNLQKDSSGFSLDSFRDAESNLISIENNYIESIIFKLLLLDFDSCISDLIKLCISLDNKSYTKLPIMVAHIVLGLYNQGLFQSPYVKLIINDFINFLPKSSMAEIILAYLAFSRSKNDSQDIIDFLLSLDLKIAIDPTYFQYIQDDDNYLDIFEVIQRQVQEHPDDVNTVRILTSFGDYSTATELIKEMMPYVSILSMKDLYTLIDVEAQLINDPIDNDYDFYIETILTALSRIDTINITERTNLTNNAKIIFQHINSESPQYNSILPMIQISEMLTLFELGKNNEAMELGYNNAILPFETDKFKEAFDLLRHPMLQDSTAIGQVIAYVCMELSTNLENRDEHIEQLASILKFSNYLDLSEGVQETLIQIRERVSIF